MRRLTIHVQIECEGQHRIKSCVTIGTRQK